jgi:hypothetical protein
MRSRLLESILIDIGIIWTIDIFIVLKPGFEGTLRPLITVLAYLLALLVVWVFLIDPGTRQAVRERNDLKAK